MSAATKCTHKKKVAFLSHLAKHGNISAAALASGVGRRTWYTLKEENEEFSASWDEAVEIATDLLILEAKRRAYKGTLKPVFHKGVQCGAVREYSDSLMMFLIKAKRPEYRDRTDVNISADISINNFSDDELESKINAALAKDRTATALIGAGASAEEAEN